MADDLDAVAAAIESLGAQVQKTMKDAVYGEVRRMKQVLQDDLNNSPTWGARHVAASVWVTYRDTPNTATGVIEPLKSANKAAGLANLAYTGSSRGGGTVRDPRAALQAEEGNIDAAVAKAMNDLFTGWGLR